MISFFAQGIPKGQPRPRAFARKMADGGYVARIFDIGTAEGWKSCIAATARPHLPASPITGPVRLAIKFQMPRPKFHSNKKGLKPGAPLWHVGKPDADNLAKAVMDALTTLGLWRDDTQVAQLIVSKVYDATMHGAMVEIHELEMGTEEQRLKRDLELEIAL